MTGKIFIINNTPSTGIYTLSLHHALPIWVASSVSKRCSQARQSSPLMLARVCANSSIGRVRGRNRSEEHTSELQSQSNLVCRLLLEKKKHIHSHYYS